MKAPKLLHWHARKAGVPVERAEALWRKALREATADTGWVGTSEFWGAAEEGVVKHFCPPNVTPRPAPPRILRRGARIGTGR